MRVCHKTEEDLFRKKIEQWVEAGIFAGAKDFDDLLLSSANIKEYFTV